MKALFAAVWEMSIIAAYTTLAVIALRLLLARFSSSYRYALWAAVLFRLLIPVTLVSALSFGGLFGGFAAPKLFSTGEAPVHTESAADLAAGTAEAGDAGIPAGMAAAPETPGVYEVPVTGGSPNSLATDATSPGQEADSPAAGARMPGWLPAIWLAGAAAMLIHGAASYWRLARRVRTATRIQDGVYESDRIDTPFAFGLVRPRVYVPLQVPQEELAYIIAHEQAHIRRFDHLVKPLAYVALSIHWFNPVIWAAFFLMGKDMELACDEHALRRLESVERHGYARALLSIASPRRGSFAVSPLHFARHPLKERVQRILSYRRPTWRWAATGALVLIILIAALVTNPPGKAHPPPAQATLPVYDANYGFDIAQLTAQRTPYIGAISNVVALLGAVPMPGASRSSVELQTTNEPYELIVHMDWSGAIDKGTGQPALAAHSFERQSAVLFAMVGNMGVIHWVLTPETGGDDYTITITREQANALAGGDTSSYADNPLKLIQLLYKDGAIDSTAFAHEQIEQLLAEIIPTPAEMSNPYSYIFMHRDAYERILKFGDEALAYLLGQFEQRANNDDLRGHIMMALCRDLLGEAHIFGQQAQDGTAGEATNEAEALLSPQEWYEQYKQQSPRKLPDFEPELEDPFEQLAYEAALYHNQQANKQPGEPFTIVAPTVFGHVEEEGKLRIFATVYSQSYRFVGERLAEAGGSVVPVAITYERESGKDYKLEYYEEAKDGSSFAPSIRAFSAKPVSGEPLEEIAAAILQDYGHNEERARLLQANLELHLQRHGVSTDLLQ